MKSVTLTIFSVLMVVCLTTAASMGKFHDLTEEDMADLVKMFKSFDTVNKRAKICSDPFMDFLNLSTSNFCRRRRRDVDMNEEK